MHVLTFHQLFLSFCLVFALTLGNIGDSSSLAGSLPNKDDVVARVNGASISKSELEELRSVYRSRTNKTSLSEDEVHSLLQNLIRRRLILAQQKTQDYRKDQSIIKAVKKFEDDLVVNRFLQDAIGDELRVSEQEITDYYKENLYQFAEPKKVEASHVLVRSQDEAEKVLAELKEGADFGDMARKYSIDLPMALEGGSMGIIEEGRTLPELEEVLFTLGEGEVSNIIKTRYGYHIVTVNKIMGPRYSVLEDVSEQIKKTLLRGKETAAYEKMVQELEKGADIQVFYVKEATDKHVAAE